MKIILHKNFEKEYKKLQKKEQTKFKEKIAIFMKNPFDIILNNHLLKGKYKGYRSINIAGDLRAIYKLLSKDNYLFVSINTHSNLYS